MNAPDTSSIALPGGAFPSGVHFRWRRRTVSADGLEARLTSKEADLFHILALQAPSPVGKRALQLALLDGTTRAVDVHLCRLRARLRHAGFRLTVATIYGEGSYLTEPAHIVPEEAPEANPVRGVIVGATAMRQLQELLQRCSGRPADAYLAEHVRSAIKVAPRLRADLTIN